MVLVVSMLDFQPEGRSGSSADLSHVGPLDWKLYFTIVSFHPGVDVMVQFYHWFNF